MEFQRKLERTYSSVTDAPQAKLDTLSRLQRNLNPAIPKLTCKAADESGESGYVCVFGVYYPSGDVLEDVTALLSEDAAGWAMDLSWCAPTPEEAEQTLLDWSRQRIALARENFIRTYGRHDRALDEFEALRTATVAVSARACDWSGIPGVYSCTYTLTLTGAWDDTPPYHDLADADEVVIRVWPHADGTWRAEPQRWRGLLRQAPMPVDVKKATADALGVAIDIGRGGCERQGGLYGFACVFDVSAPNTSRHIAGQTARVWLDDDGLWRADPDWTHRLGDAPRVVDIQQGMRAFIDHTRKEFVIGFGSAEAAPTSIDANIRDWQTRFNAQQDIVADIERGMTGTSGTACTWQGPAPSPGPDLKQGTLETWFVCVFDQRLAPGWADGHYPDRTALLERNAEGRWTLRHTDIGAPSRRK